MGKGENAGLLFPQCYQKLSFPELFNPLPDDKILDWFKLKQIADESAFKMKNKCHTGEKTLREKENLQFLLFSQCFPQP